ncbi:hypothetical protein [Lacticaseibacillus mingshuiensis]|uniref:Uncharacterized protein n=2 Tax=Lacticaseibacillus mingshuiensis TaxID=2799574 RepID=A0ABW4CGD7_9LACO|nr:hypothetical protein [Lacticaseibacillus mingshuiensis]
MTIGRPTQDDQTDLHNNSDELTDNDDNTLTGESASQLASDDRVQTNAPANDENSGAESVAGAFSAESEAEETTNIAAVPTEREGNDPTDSNSTSIPDVGQVAVSETATAPTTQEEADTTEDLTALPYLARIRETLSDDRVLGKSYSVSTTLDRMLAWYGRVSVVWFGFLVWFAYHMTSSTGFDWRYFKLEFTLLVRYPFDVDFLCLGFYAVMIAVILAAARWYYVKNAIRKYASRMRENPTLITITHSMPVKPYRLVYQLTNGGPLLPQRMKKWPESARVDWHEIVAMINDGSDDSGDSMTTTEGRLENLLAKAEPDVTFLGLTEEHRDLIWPSSDGSYHDLVLVLDPAAKPVRVVRNNFDQETQRPAKD